MGGGSAYGIVFSDVDGTLLDARHALTARTARAVRRYVRSGGVFAICTGRMPAGVAHIVAELGVAVSLVCYSGALVLDEAGGVVSSRRLSAADALGALEVASSIGCGIAPSFFVGKDWLAPDPDAPNIRAESQVVKTAPARGDLPGLVASGILPNKVFFNCSGDLAGGRQLAAALRRTLTGARVVHSDSGVLLEVLPAGVDKAVGARDLAAHHGMTLRDAAAFGDDVNDIEMLRAVRHGVAMGNASDEVKASARQTAPRNDEDGLARVLETWLDERSAGSWTGVQTM